MEKKRKILTAQNVLFFIIGKKKEKKDVETSTEILKQKPISQKNQCSAKIVQPRKKKSTMKRIQKALWVLSFRVLDKV